MKPLVAAVAVLVALAAGVQAQTPFVDALRARAEAGDAEAQLSLAVGYAIGNIVAQDDAEAVRWYRRAANQGHADAQLSLGFKYEDGQGIPQDYAEAHMWFNLATSRMTGGNREFAVRNRDRVAGRMTPAQLVEAQRLATAWDAAHPREP